MEELMNVLVVDDEKIIRDGCRRVLTEKGFQVLTSENGVQAMEMLSSEDVDIILLDLKMPVMSGEEVLDRVTVQYPDIPVIIITGHGTIDTAVHCMKKGAYDFVTKPFQIDQFLLTINRASDKRRLEKKARQFQEQNIKNLYDLDMRRAVSRPLLTVWPTVLWSLTGTWRLFFIIRPL